MLVSISVINSASVVNKAGFCYRINNELDYKLTNLILFEYILKKAKYVKVNSIKKIFIVLVNNLLHYEFGTIKLQTMVPYTFDKKY